MKKHFYSNIVEIDSLIVELESIDLTKTEKMHLSKLIDANIHHTVLDTVLSELDDEDKKIFMEHLSSDDHDKIWMHLNKRIINIEEKIKKVVENLKTELYQDIKKAKKII